MSHDVTRDAVLGGRVTVLQPVRGHRVGHDAILLAAACPAMPGDHVVDFGAGVGAVGLAIAARVGAVKLTLIERDPDLAALAGQNLRLNAISSGAALTRDVEALGDGAADDPADHIVMNPPFNDDARLQPSPDRKRRGAHAADVGLLGAWVAAAFRMLKSGGSLTMIWRADGLSPALQSLAGSFGGIVVAPVYTARGKDAARVLIGGIKGSRAPMALRPPLMLMDEAGQSHAAQRLLRDAQPFDLFRRTD